MALSVMHFIVLTVTVVVMVVVAVIAMLRVALCMSTYVALYCVIVCY